MHKNISLYNIAHDVYIVVDHAGSTSVPTVPDTCYTHNFSTSV